MKSRQSRKVKTKTYFDTLEEVIKRTSSHFIRGLGPTLVLGLYVILMLHVHAFFWVILPLLKKRLGMFGLVWITIGLSLLYNIVYNHLMAALIKPSGPKDLRLVEKLRKAYKQ
jgi:hypothetical protein